MAVNFRRGRLFLAQSSFLGANVRRREHLTARRAGISPGQAQEALGPLARLAEQRFGFRHLLVSFLARLGGLLQMGADRRIFGLELPHLGRCALFAVRRLEGLLASSTHLLLRPLQSAEQRQGQ